MISNSWIVCVFHANSLNVEMKTLPRHHFMSNSNAGFIIIVLKVMQGINHWFNLAMESPSNMTCKNNPIITLACTKDSNVLK